MAISEWIPLAAGALAVYWGSTRIAGMLLHAKESNDSDDDESASGKRSGVSLFKRPESKVARDRSSASTTPTKRTRPAPVSEPEPQVAPAQRKAINRDVAAKIEQAAGVLNRGPDTLPMDLADPKLQAEGQGPQTVSDIDLGDGPIGSLDFTLDDSPGPGQGGVDLHSGDMGITPAVVVENSAEDIGKTLMLDTEELMKAIRRGPAANLPTAAAPAAPDAAPIEAPKTEDWSAALDGIKDWQIESSAQSFFSAPQAGRDMGTTQAFKLDHAALAAPKGSNASPVSAVAASTSEFAAPDLNFPDLTFEPPSSQATAPTIPVGANASFHESPQERNEARDHFAHRPGRSKPMDRVRVEAIEHEEFRDLAIAHDDIQSARVVFEEVRQMFGGAADPIFRALVFGAIVSYCRPFHLLADHPCLQAFNTPRYKKAHQELVLAHRRLVEERDTGDDEVVRMYREGAAPDEDGMSFAVRTSLVNEQRLPLYIALCQALEIKLLEQLQVIGEEILGPAPAASANDNQVSPRDDAEFDDTVILPVAPKVSAAELDMLVAPALHLTQPMGVAELSLVDRK